MENFYIKNIDGKDIIKNRKNIVLKYEKQVLNEKTNEYEVYSVETHRPSDEMLLEHEWVKYEGLTISEDEVLLMNKSLKENEIKSYDSSDEVNIFYIQDLPVWLDKNTRAGLKLRFESEIAAGKTDTILWHNNMQFTLSLENAIQMLYAIEIYASQCYDNTQIHLTNVAKLTTVEEVEKYDYRTGYPDKLRF